MKKPVIRRVIMGAPQEEPAAWDPRTRSFHCPCGRTLRRDPKGASPTAIPPALGKRCGGCYGTVVSLEEFDPFG